MDVGHRFIPDLIWVLFNRLRYDDGLRSYFRHTFLYGDRRPDKTLHLLLEGEPELRGNVLLVPWTQTEHGVLPEDPPLRDALSLAQRIVSSGLTNVFKRISEEGDEDREYPNLNIRIQSQFRAGQWDDVRKRHLAWALFPLAIAEPDSDSRAAQIAAQLVPHLVEYVHGSQSGRQHAATASEQSQTERLLRLIPDLRPNSPALRNLVDRIEVTIQGLTPDDYVESIQREMKSALTKRRLRSSNWNTTSGDATVFFVFGASEPVAHYLAAAAKRSYEQKRTMTVYPVYCERKWTGSKIEDRDIPTQDQALPMERETRVALEMLNLPDTAIDWKPRIDSFRIPTICHDCFPEGNVEMELLFGARAFVTVPYRGRPTTTAITIYGCHALSVLCESLGIRSHVVTWDSRLQAPLAEFRINPGEFRFSYSLTPDDDHDTENERVPLYEISSVVTEVQRYSSEEAQRIVIAKGPVQYRDLGPSILPPPREPGWTAEQDEQDEQGSGRRSS